MYVKKDFARRNKDRGGAKGHEPYRGLGLNVFHLGIAHLSVICAGEVKCFGHLPGRLSFNMLGKDVRAISTCVLLNYSLKFR